MVQSAPQTIFGVHSLVLYDRANWLPFGHIRILGGLNLALEGDFVDLFGGCNRFAWDSEAGTLDTNLTGTIKEIPNFAFEKFLGGSATASSAEASGNTGTIANKKGTSVVAATGIATSTTKAGSEADLKDAVYIVRAVSATTVDVYSMSSVDFDKGTDLTFQDDLLKITASPLTITASTAVEIPNTGVELTGGAGAIGMTTDDTAIFYTRKVNSGSDLITVGGTQSFPEFGVMGSSCKKSNGDTFTFQLFRCKGIGLPLALAESAWLETDITIKALYDSDEEKVGEIRRIRGA